MKFVGTLVVPRIDLSAYRQAMHEALKERLALAVFHYLDAVLAKVPVWSGASAATFLQLAKTIEYPLNIEPATQLGFGVSYGRARGKGELKDEASSGLFFFTYSTTLAHLIWNENNPPPGPGQFGVLKRPGPYHFQEVGKAAFDKVAKATRLPNPFDSLKLRNIRVGR